MNDCIKYQELISCSIDNEISDADKEALDRHLAECESCRKVMEAFSAISESERDNLAEVPSQFARSTMGLIRSEASRPKGVIRFFSAYGKYTAIAAVLAILLIGGNNILSNMKMGSSSAADAIAANMSIAGGTRSEANAVASESACVEGPAEDAGTGVVNCEEDAEEIIQNANYAYAANSGSTPSAAFAMQGTKDMERSLADDFQNYSYDTSFYCVCSVFAPAPAEITSGGTLLFSGDGVSHYEIPVSVFSELEAQNVFHTIIFEDDSAEAVLVFVYD